MFTTPGGTGISADLKKARHGRAFLRGQPLVWRSVAEEVEDAVALLGGGRRRGACSAGRGGAVHAQAADAAVARVFLVIPLAAHVHDARGHRHLCHRHALEGMLHEADRKSTRLNSSHLVISYAVF